MKLRLIQTVLKSWGEDMQDLIKRTYQAVFFYDDKQKEWIVYAIYKDETLAHEEAKKINKQGFGQTTILPVDFYMKGVRK